MQYRRAKQMGGAYFFTVVTYDRKPILTIPENIQRLREAFRHVMRKHPMDIEGIVILPDHLHCLWRLPERDNDFSLRWSKIKRYFSLSAAGVEQVHVSETRRRKREKAVWQRRFWEHLIRDEQDWRSHMDYMALIIVSANPMLSHRISNKESRIMKDFKVIPFDIQMSVMCRSWLNQ